MVNYQIFRLCHILEFLRLQESRFAMLALRAPGLLNSPGLVGFSGAFGSGNLSVITDQHKDEIKPLLTLVKSECQLIEIRPAIDRIDIFIRKLRSEISPQDFVAELRVIREAIETDINLRYFYYYPQRKAEILNSFESDWGHIIRSFPSVKLEAHCAVDLYALNHNAASVFHSMRVAEHGLRAIAKERQVQLPKKKPVEWATWQDIIKAITAEAECIAKTKAAGAAKDRALEFYSGALADLNSFKDEYRNLVMHVRSEYDEVQSLRAMQRVHAFMERISNRIDHRHHRIRWGFR
jgi:hypothetical protein